jgi:hypothetical protein
MKHYGRPLGTPKFKKIEMVHKSTLEPSSKYTKFGPSLSLKLKIFIKVRPIKLEIVGQMFLTWTWNHWALNFLNIP